MANNENRRKVEVLDEIRILWERIDKDFADASTGWKLVSHVKSKKALERKESDLQARHSSACSKLRAEIDELEKLLRDNENGEVHSDSFDLFIQDASERLMSAKKELAAKLRAIISLKRQLDEVPSQSELIQYERRLPELYTQIQKKHRQTRKHYDTYNALMEIKEIMVKETSLLNSISIQFQNAMASPDGRTRLLESLEGISKGINQKLEKVQVALLSEQKLCDSLKEKYAAVIAEQRRSSSLVKLFQEECARNESLRDRTS